MEITAVVLAAGTASRMGTQKLLLPIDGTPMIDRVLAASQSYPIVVVASKPIADFLSDRSNIHIVRNNRPELGMAHSLCLAHDAIVAEQALLVFLGDKPWVTRSLAAAVAAHAVDNHADICFPSRAGVGGHPVFFSPKARSHLKSLKGDSLQTVRDHKALKRLSIPIDDDAPYADVDTAEALRLRSGE